MQGDTIFKEYRDTIPAGEVRGYSVGSCRSFLIWQVLDSDGNNNAGLFKVGNQSEMPAEFVTLQSGFGSFIGQTFNRIEIQNPHDALDLQVVFCVSTQLISDSRVYGSVQVANATLPKSAITDPDILVPLLTSDFRTQLTTNYANAISYNPGFGLVLSIAPKKGCVSFTGYANTVRGQYNLLTIAGDQYIDSITVTTGALVPLLFLNRVLINAFANTPLPIKSFMRNGDTLQYSVPSGTWDGSFSMTITR